MYKLIFIIRTGILQSSNSAHHCCLRLTNSHPTTKTFLHSLSD